MKKVLFMHSGSGNHGCEAIIRTTAELLGGPEDVVLWSLAKQEDEKYGAADLLEKVVVSEELQRFSLGYFEALLKRKLFKQQDANMNVFLREQFGGNIAISVGGDNYCYPWSAKQAIVLVKEIRKSCRASVLWGCSIDPEAVTPEMEEDLKQFDLITAREPLTYELLKRINPNTVKVSDPAFTLERVDLPLPENFVEGNTVGINISPLIMKYGTDGNVILKNYKELIQHILDHTDMGVCLIPHVVWEHNNDLEPLNVLWEKFAHTGRVSRILDGNCCELKGYIARCRFFVGARTHATIAAYSTLVPTLVVGYSVKSRGIALDLFGTEENYVLPVQSLKTETDLTNAFAWLQAHEQAVRCQLGKVMANYIENARVGAAFLQTL
jgi:polysaccharide pyruvyl transferase WcaK-like protein